ncbi:MAG: hypothetical protein HY506_00125 [Candidatus Yanofskybacteria bacterium]|nr:hypothetical protein [Candidatus Yanofskybacteria bacterium]
MEKIPEERKPNMDDVSKEAHEMFMEKQVDDIQEALHIDRAIKLIMRYMKEGKLTLGMSIDDALEKLEDRKAELIGEGEEEDDSVEY